MSSRASARDLARILRLHGAPRGMTISTRSLALLGMTLLTTQSLAQAPPDFEKYVASVMTAFEVPGVSVAIVRDGKVLLAKGYGVRKLGDPAAVDAETLFGIASNTKAFTATALGMLVEEGKDRVGRAGRPLPARFRAVRSVRHPRADRARPAGASERPRPGGGRPPLVAALDVRPQGDLPAAALHPAGHSFRNAYAYDNVLYLVAGEVIEAVSGMR